MENSVLKNIKARKGISAPFNDGRKIGLVLPGGMMTGVNGAGAMCALQALGLTQAFDVVYTASAGFPNASYFLSENTEIGSSIYYEEFSGNNFINLWRFWEPVSVEWAVHCVRDIKPVDFKKIWDSKTDFLLRVIDYKDKRKRVYVNIKDYSPTQYFDLLKASISSPLVTRCTQIDVKKFCDGQVVNNDVISHINYALAGDCTDLLIIYNQESQKDLLKLSEGDRYFEITPTGDSKIGVFETRSEILKKAHSAMKENVHSFFKNLKSPVLRGPF